MLSQASVILSTVRVGGPHLEGRVWSEGGWCVVGGGAGLVREGLLFPLPIMGDPPFFQKWLMPSSKMGDPPQIWEYCQCMVGTHPHGMHSCCAVF